MSEIIEGIANTDLADKIEWEGLEYFFLDYIDPIKVADEKLQRLVEDFQATRYEITHRLTELGVGGSR